MVTNYGIVRYRCYIRSSTLSTAAGGSYGTSASFMRKKNHNATEEQELLSRTALNVKTHKQSEMVSYITIILMLGLTFFIIEKLR